MDFNSILIGSEDPQRLADYYTKLFGEPSGVTAATRSGRSAAARYRRPARPGHGPEPQPGRIIWNIESADVRADFDRLVQPARSSSASRTASRARTASSPRWPIPTTTTSS